MTVGIISDTHGVFSNGFREFLEPVDVIWHAGDFGGGLSFAGEIASFKPLIGVYGNCDGQDIRSRYPRSECFNAEGKKVLITHIGGSPGHYDMHARELLEKYRPDIFVCGHSHILRVQYDRQRDMMYINPGAAGIQGWHIERTALRFKIEDGTLKDMELYRLPRTQK